MDPPRTEKIAKPMAATKRPASRFDRPAINEPSKAQPINTTAITRIDSTGLWPFNKLISSSFTGGTPSDRDTSQHRPALKRVASVIRMRERNNAISIEDYLGQIPNTTLTCSG